MFNKSNIFGIFCKKYKQTGEMSPTAAHLTGEKTLTILHFNDVYNVESVNTEPVGGAARFCTAFKSFSHLHPLVLFSGDVFAPSFSMC